MPEISPEALRILEAFLCTFVTGGFWRLVAYAKSINGSIVELNKTMAVMITKLDWHEQEIKDLKRAHRAFVATQS
jgi:hypothetical protein